MQDGQAGNGGLVPREAALGFNVELVTQGDKGCVFIEESAHCVQGLGWKEVAKITRRVVQTITLQPVLSIPVPGFTLSFSPFPVFPDRIYFRRHVHAPRFPC